jgi:protein associated with RNAse G/E
VGASSEILTLNIIRAPNIAGGRSFSALTRALARSLPNRTCFTKLIVTPKRGNDMWQPGDVIFWRGIYRNRIWHCQPTLLVKDSPQEVVTSLLPGTECIADENYPNGKRNSRPRWEFKEKDWVLAPYIWQTNRLLLVFEHQKYYSTILFWDHTSHAFLCYYINFQLPFQRNQCALDTLDLDLDLIVRPDFSLEWKDVEDYQKAIEQGLILPEWTRQIEIAKVDVLERIEKRKYPFDGSWLDWRPDPNWSPPRLLENWDKI